MKSVGLKLGEKDCTFSFQEFQLSFKSWRNEYFKTDMREQVRYDKKLKM